MAGLALNQGPPVATAQCGRFYFKNMTPTRALEIKCGDQGQMEFHVLQKKQNNLHR